jgi:hypothetical protein
MKESKKDNKDYYSRVAVTQLLLCVLLLSIMITVVVGEGYELSDLGEMWTDAAEDVVGGHTPPDKCVVRMQEKMEKILATLLKP